MSYVYDVTVRVRAETMIGTESAAELVRIALEPLNAAIQEETAVPMTPDEFAQSRASDWRVPATRAAYETYLQDVAASSGTCSAPAEIIGSAEAGEDAGTVGLSNKRLEDASGGAS